MVVDDYIDKVLGSEYVIESATAKPEVHYNPWHDKIRGKHCNIQFLEEGYGAVLLVDVDYDSFRHHFYTSDVVHVSVDEDGNVEFETKNTFYKLTFCGKKEDGDTL